MKLIAKTLLLTVLTLGPTTTPKAIAAGAGTPALGPLAGEYAIRTYDKGYVVSTRNGGQESENAVVTSGRRVVGPYNKFRFEKLGPNFTLLKTARGYYVSAANGGGHSGNFVQALQTMRTSMAEDSLVNIRSDSPGHRPFTIQTFRNFYLTANDGGGRYFYAFNTDRVKHQGSWEDFQVLKCGDLGSDYDYAIKPTGEGLGPAPHPLQARYGGGQVQNSVGFVNTIFSRSFQRFKLRRHSDGSYALQTANQRNYVTAIQGGGPASGTKDWDNLVTDRTQVQAWEKFSFVDRGNCEYTIQTTNNWYVAWNPARGISTRISDPGAPSFGYTAYFHLIPFL